MICRRSACRNVRLKWRNDSGPARRMPTYLSFWAMIRCLPLGSMRGSCSSSPMICASSSSDSSTSSACSPA